MYCNKSLTALPLHKILVLLSFIISTACSDKHLPDFLKFKNQAAQEGVELIPVARVHDNYLYRQDLEGIIEPGISRADSASIMDRYVDSWIKKQLLINEAATKIDFDEAELERKALDYRYALMIYEFEKNHVNQKIDNDVSEEEIKTYYENNKANFELKQNIIKGIFAKVPQEAPRVGRLRSLFQDKLSSENREEIKSYCLSFASSYSMDDSVWYNFEEVIKNTPLISIPNKVQFLRENKFVETSDDLYVYLFKITDYKISDQMSPLEFVKDDITKIILNKRKVALTQKLKEEIYANAKKTKEFEIFNTQSVPQNVAEQHIPLTEEDQ